MLSYTFLNMSIIAPQTRAYIRSSPGQGLRSQQAVMDANGIGRELIYIQGKTEDLTDCLKSLMPGDTLAVTTLARLHNTRHGLLAAIRELAKRRVTLWLLIKDRRYSPDELAGPMEETVEALVELADDKRRMTSADASAAALKRWSRTPAVKAQPIWDDKANYPTSDEALSHADMKGWTYEEALKKFGPRYPAVRRKR